MKIGVIGCGKMAGSIVGRWLDVGAVDAADVHAVEVDRDRAAAVQERFGVRCSLDGKAVIADSDVVLLGIKPQQAGGVVPVLADAVPDGQVWLSILAGTRAARLHKLLGGGAKVVRLMPNTPARLGLGCTAVAWPDGLAPARRDAVQALLEALGEVVPLAEGEIDSFTAIAGSGPAYVFLFLEALAASGRKLGFSPEQARTMALTTLRGATALAAEDPRPFGALRQDVTSPGGTTAEALHVFYSEDWPGIVERATQACARRAAELAG